MYRRQRTKRTSNSKEIAHGNGNVFFEACNALSVPALFLNVRRLLSESLGAKQAAFHSANAFCVPVKGLAVLHLIIPSAIFLSRALFERFFHIKHVARFIYYFCR